MAVKSTRRLDGLRWLVLGLLPSNVRATHEAIAWLCEEPPFAAPSFRRRRMSKKVAGVPSAA